uniref:response regulator n=1 Tax=Nocardia brasiliensis TaxID=37326 RepID=UPI002454A3E0
MTGHRILVVDDEVRVLASLRRGLELSDFEVITASDGAEALTMCRTQTPDAMVLDVNMPTLDGEGVGHAVGAVGHDKEQKGNSPGPRVDDLGRTRLTLGDVLGPTLGLIPGRADPVAGIALRRVVVQK